MFTTVDAVNAASKRRSVLAHKQSGTFLNAMWMGSGPGWPAGAAAPAPPGATCDASTPGALPLPASASGLYLMSAKVRVMSNSQPAARLYLCDRLVHSAGVNPTLTTEQFINTVALPRFTSGEGVVPIFEFSAGNSCSSITTVTINYTNELGVSGRLGTSPTTSQMGYTSGMTGSGVGQADWAFLALAGGDGGVRSVESVTLSNSGGVSSTTNIGVTLVKPICLLDLGDSISIRGDDWGKDWKFLGLPFIDPSACLCAYVTPSTQIGSPGGPFLDLVFGNA